MSNSSGLGDRIHKVIAESSYTSKEVADKIGVSPQAVSKAVRTSSMGKDNLRKMAEFLDVNAEWLINGKEKFNGDFDIELMTKCVTAFRKAVEETGIDADDEDVTRLALKLYQLNR